MLISVVMDPNDVPELHAQLLDAQRLIEEAPDTRAIAANIGLSPSGEIVINGRLLNAAQTKDLQRFTNGARLHELAIIDLACQLVDLCSNTEADVTTIDDADTAYLVCRLEAVVSHYRAQVEG